MPKVLKGNCYDTPKINDTVGSVLIDRLRTGSV